MTYKAKAKAKGAPELGTAGGPDRTFRGPWATFCLSPNFYEILSSRQFGSLPVYTTVYRPFANCFDGLQGVAKAYLAR